MHGIFEHLKRLTYRIQPVSQIQKRGKRKQEQKQRKTYHEISNYISKVRKEMGYGDGKEWQV